ncbi:MAG: lytic transglycosylase domain-containing protein [bacterium]
MKSMIIPVLMGLLSISFFAVNSDVEQTNVAKIKASLQSVQAMVQVDNVRQHTSQKVLQIINRYNPNMPLNMKKEIVAEINKMSLKYANLDVDLICATITHESGRTWKPNVVSNAGAMGLMQIMPHTGEWLTKYEGIKWTSAEEILFNPIYNIRLGSRYLSALIESYDLEGGLAAYNGGRKIAELWLENNKADGILWAETKNYIPYVLKLYDEYKSFTL